MNSCSLFLLPSKRIRIFSAISRDRDIFSVLGFELEGTSNFGYRDMLIDLQQDGANAGPHLAGAIPAAVLLPRVAGRLPAKTGFNSEQCSLEVPCS